MYPCDNESQNLRKASNIRFEVLLVLVLEMSLIALNNVEKVETVLVQ